MVRLDISKCQTTGIICTLACLTTFLLLSINTVNCIASESSSRNDPQVSVTVASNENRSLDGSASVSAPSNGNTGQSHPNTTAVKRGCCNITVSATTNWLWSTNDKSAAMTISSIFPVSATITVSISATFTSDPTRHQSATMPSHDRTSSIPFNNSNRTEISTKFVALPNATTMTVPKSSYSNNNSILPLNSRNNTKFASNSFITKIFKSSSLPGQSPSPAVTTSMITPDTFMATLTIIPTLSKPSTMAILSTTISFAKVESHLSSSKLLSPTIIANSQSLAPSQTSIQQPTSPVMPVASKKFLPSTTVSESSGETVSSRTNYRRSTQSLSFPLSPISLKESSGSDISSTKVLPPKTALKSYMETVNAALSQSSPSAIQTTISSHNVISSTALSASTSQSQMESVTKTLGHTQSPPSIQIPRSAPDVISSTDVLAPTSQSHNEIVSRTQSRTEVPNSSSPAWMASLGHSKIGIISSTDLSSSATLPPSLLRTVSASSSGVQQSSLLMLTFTSNDTSVLNIKSSATSSQSHTDTASTNQSQMSIQQSASPMLPVTLMVNLQSSTKFLSSTTVSESYSETVSSKMNRFSTQSSSFPILTVSLKDSHESSRSSTKVLPSKTALKSQTEIVNTALSLSSSSPILTGISSPSVTSSTEVLALPSVQSKMKTVSGTLSHTQFRPPNQTPSSAPDVISSIDVLASTSQSHNETVSSTLSRTNVPNSSSPTWIASSEGHSKMSVISSTDFSSSTTLPPLLLGTVSTNSSRVQQSSLPMLTITSNDTSVLNMKSLATSSQSHMDSATANPSQISIQQSSSPVMSVTSRNSSLVNIQSSTKLLSPKGTNPSISSTKLLPLLTAPKSYVFTASRSLSHTQISPSPIQTASSMTHLKHTTELLALTTSQSYMETVSRATSRAYTATSSIQTASLVLHVTSSTEMEALTASQSYMETVNRTLSRAHTPTSSSDILTVSSEESSNWNMISSTDLLSSTALSQLPRGAVSTSSSRVQQSSSPVLTVTSYDSLVLNIKSSTELFSSTTSPESYTESTSANQTQASIQQLSSPIMSVSSRNSSLVSIESSTKFLSSTTVSESYKKTVSSTWDRLSAPSLSRLSTKLLSSSTTLKANVDTASRALSLSSPSPIQAASSVSNVTSSTELLASTSQSHTETDSKTFSRAYIPTSPIQIASSVADVISSTEIEASTTPQSYMENVSRTLNHSHTARSAFGTASSVSNVLSSTDFLPLTTSSQSYTETARINPSQVSFQQSSPIMSVSSRNYSLVNIQSSTKFVFSTTVSESLRETVSSRLNQLSTPSLNITIPTISLKDSHNSGISSTKLLLSTTAVKSSVDAASRSLRHSSSSANQTESSVHCTSTAMLASTTSQSYMETVSRTLNHTHTARFAIGTASSVPNEKSSTDLLLPTTSSQSYTETARTNPSRVSIQKSYSPIISDSSRNSSVVNIKSSTNFLSTTTIAESSGETVNSRSNRLSTPSLNIAIPTISLKGSHSAIISSTKLLPSTTAVKSSMDTASRALSQSSYSPIQTESPVSDVISATEMLVSTISRPYTETVSRTLSRAHIATPPMQTASLSPDVISATEALASTTLQSQMETFSRTLRYTQSAPSGIQTASSVSDVISSTEVLVSTTFQSYMETVRRTLSHARTATFSSRMLSIISSTDLSSPTLSQLYISTIRTSSSQFQQSRSAIFTVTSKDSVGSSIVFSTDSVKRSSSYTLHSFSPLLTVTSKKSSSEFNTPTSVELLTSILVSHVTTGKPVSTIGRRIETSRPSSPISKITSARPLVFSTVSSAESIIPSTISHTALGSSRSTDLLTSRLSSKPKIITGATTLSKAPSSSQTDVQTASNSSVIGSEVSTSTLYTATPLTSSIIVTPVDAEKFTVQVTLLIALTVALNDIFKQNLAGKLERLFDLGLSLTKTTLSRKRRAINEKMFPMNRYGRNLHQLIQKDFDTPKQIANGRFRRQTTNETRVQIVNVTRATGKGSVHVTFYVIRGNSPVPAKQVAKIMNAPSTDEKFKTLEYAVSGEFSAAFSQEEKTDKKSNETLLIVLAVCIPVLFVFGACTFIKCKKTQRRSRKLKLNKVSIEQPTAREKMSVPESAIEERYTRAPTLPMKDYPDVIIQTPERRKQRTKKAKTPKVPKTEDENPATAAPAAAFENITRMSFDSPSNVAIDDIPLRLRPAVRQESEPQKPAGKDMVEDSGVPRSWIENKNRVDMKSKKGDRKEEEKMATDAPGGNTHRYAAELDDADSNDTIQIKANIEKWRNKMRQREKRKERREVRKLKKQDKLIELEEKKLSRREWLMAQPEIQAILDGEDLSRPASLRKKKHRRERWPESRKHLDSDSDDEVTDVPVRRHHRRRRWPQRSARRVYPSEHDGVRFIAVRPKKPRVYAFEEPGPEREFEPRYIVPEDSSVPLQGPSEPVIPEAVQLIEEYSYSPDSVYDEEFYDPYVPEYGESRYYQPPRTGYLITQAPIALEQQLPLRMQETSFSGTPHRPQRPIGPKKAPRGMYFEQQPPRPSNLYSRARKPPGGAKCDTLTDKTGHTSSGNAPQGTAPPSENTTPHTTTVHTPSPGKSVNASSQSDISPGRSWESKTNEDFKNYSINESEARKLVSRVLDRAKSEADRG